jgi:predicted nuclease of predicted toxin-antitoxin system
VKILLDQNISYRVANLLTGTFETVDHIKLLKLTDASDIDIWRFAKSNGHTIITFDSDFVDLATLYGTPPKVIWLRFGNSSNLKIANKLIGSADLIRSFINDGNKNIGFLEID